MGAKFAESVTKKLSAGFSGLWVRSHDHRSATEQIVNACHPFGWVVLHWDAEQGVVDATHRDPGRPTTQDNRRPEMNTTDLLTAITAFRGYQDPPQGYVKIEGEEYMGRTILVLRNPHLFMWSGDRIVDPVLVQALQRTLEIGEQHRLHIVFLVGDHVNLLPDLEKKFFVIDHDLPTADEVWDIFSTVTLPGELPEKGTREAAVLVDAAAGLTEAEAAGAIALAIVDRPKTGTKKISPASLWDIKANILSKSGTLQMAKPSSGFEMIGGLNSLKQFCLRMFQSDNWDPQCRPAGVGLLGVPGVGKSAFAKALGMEVGRPTITLDFGRLMGGIVGQTEERTRAAFRTIDAMSPCILFVD